MIFKNQVNFSILNLWKFLYFHLIYQIL